MMRYHPTAGFFDDVNALVQQTTAGTAQAVTDTAMPQLLSNTAFQDRVGTAAGVAVAREYRTPVYLMTGAAVVSALAVVYMAISGSGPRRNPEKRR